MKHYVHGLIILLGLTAAAHAQQATEQENQGRQAKIDKDAPGIIAVLAAENCFTSGSGMSFLKVCITVNGNISWLESPAGFVHIKSREGYAVCSVNSGTLTVHGFDVNTAAEGWGAPIVSDNKRIITRTSLGGMVQLKQTFTVVPTGPGVDVKMEIKNLSPVVLDEVAVTRYFDGDIDGSTTNMYDQIPSWSVWGRYLHGLMLSPAPTPSHGFEPIMTTFAQWNPLGTGAREGRTCYSSPAPSGFLGDYVGGMFAARYALMPGKTHVVTLHYRRF